MAGMRRQTAIGYAFIAPWLVALAVFIGYPFLAGFYFSFCDFPPLRTPVFIGLDNYHELATDALFQRSMGVTLLYAAVAIPIGVALAITLAMLLAARIRGQAFYRVFFYIPHLVPTVVVAILWLWIFNPKYGLLNLILAAGVNAADGWTARFFNLEAAASGGDFASARVCLLVAVPLAAVAAMRLARTALARRPHLRRLLAATTAALLVLAAGTVLNAVLHRVAPVDMQKLHSPGWLSDGSPFPSAVSFAPSWALWALIVMSLWGVGQMAIIYLAKLQDVPADLYEAADIDGATWWQKSLHITLPMISPVILFNVVMAIIGTFQVFTEPYIMTGGGPEDKTRFVAMFVYDQAFMYQRVGYASAVAWVLFLVIVVLTVLAFSLFQKRVYYAGR